MIQSCLYVHLLLFASVSLESSVMGHDELLQVLKEKMRLEGQLESLSSEANQVFSRYFLLLQYQSFIDNLIFHKYVIIK